MLSGQYPARIHNDVYVVGSNGQVRHWNGIGWSYIDIGAAGVDLNAIPAGAIERIEVVPDLDGGVRTLGHGRVQHLLHLVGGALDKPGRVLEVGNGDVCWNNVTAHQEIASTGFYARAMAAFVRWVAGAGLARCCCPDQKPVHRVSV